jgi:magnesium transporter
LLSGSIDEYLVTDVPLCGPDMKAGVLHALLVGHRYESAADVAVCAYDGVSLTHRLLGLIPLEIALAAEPESVARDLMDADPPLIAPGMDQEKAAWKAARHGESSLGVVDSEGTLLGLVPPARLLTVLLREHDEDLARIGGFLRSTTSARHALQEPVLARLWHRLPWLLVGLAGSAGAATLMKGFETDLADDVRLAFFIPGLVYLADAVGTQTEALIIRGLSVGAPIRRVLRLELVTGLFVGLVLAALSLPAVWLAFDSRELALTVSLSLAAASGVATIVGLWLPWTMSRVGVDPAFGSGPLATVIQDLLTLMIYFAIASVVVV